jgi:hypothetical protein
MSAEHKLEEQINNQAKSIADQQIKAQAEAQAKGSLKISSAAAALNNAELGVKAEVSTEEASRIMSISSDQLYVDESKKADPVEPQPQVGEAAAITMAKQAAKTFVSSHPETQKFANATNVAAKKEAAAPAVKKAIEIKPKVAI